MNCWRRTREYRPACGAEVESNGETHITFLYGIDQKGNFRLTLIGPKMDPKDVAADVQHLIEGILMLCSSLLYGCFSFGH